MEELQQSLKYKQWRASLDEAGIEIRSVKELHSVRKRQGELLFSLIHMDASAPEGNPLLPIVLLRGHFVSILTCLRDSESGEEFFLLVRQRRVANGALFYEHPAGMTDSDQDPWKIALLELEEETGVKVSREQLTLLREDKLYSSPGLLDEGGYFFCCELEMSREEIMAYHEASHGEGGEGEFITTYVAKPDEAKSLIRNANGLLNIYLFEDYRKASSN